MKLENQVVSLELAQKLKELGVKQESYFMWHCAGDRCSVGEVVEIFPDTNPEFRMFNKTHNTASAYTVAELGEMLPCFVVSGESRTYWLEGSKDWNSSQGDNTEWNYCAVTTGDGKAGHTLEYCIATTEADARAKMLIYLLENKLITL